MRHRRTRTFLCVAVWLVTAHPARATVSTYVPLSHWAYEALDRLSATGLVLSDLPGTRPYSRLEAARLIVEARERCEAEALHPSALTRVLLSRLEDEFREEVNWVQSPGAEARASFLKPLEDPYLRVLYGENAAQLQNEAGDRYDPKDNWRAGFVARGRLRDRVAFHVQPEYRSPWPTNKNLRIVEGYGVLGLGPVDLQLGKANLWWGPGRHGAMIMSRNAEGLNLLKIATPNPLLLPGPLRYLGPLKASFFLSELEKARFQPRANLTGIRLDFKPHPQVEVGLSRTIMFGGDNFNTGVWDVMQIFWPKNIQGQENQLAALDLAWRIPMPKQMVWRALKLYGEYAGEDSAGFSKYTPLLGFQVQDIGWQGTTDLRVEYASTYLPRAANTFYQHGVFQSGYTYKGDVLGHHVGTDGRDVFARLTHYVTADVRLGVDFDQELYRTYVRPRAERRQFGVDLQCFLPLDLELMLRYQLDEVRNDPSRPDNHIVDLALVYNF